MTARRFSQSDLPSGAESRESHLAFIRQNIDIAAAVAWQGYQDKGRCAMLIVTRWGDNRQPWTAGITPACVLSRKRVLRILDDANPLARSDLARLLREYDSQQEVAFTFFRLDGGVSSYRVASPKFTPPEAYEAMKGQMADFVLTEAEVMAYVEKADGRQRG